MQGWLVLCAAGALSTLDVIALVARGVQYVKSVRAGEQPFNLKVCWNTIILDREDHSVALGAEYAGLVSEEPEELEAAELKAREIEQEPSSSRGLPPIDTAMSPVLEEQETEQWANDVRHHSRYPQSAGSERTVFEPHSPRGSVHSDETLHSDEFHPLNWIRGSTKSSILRKIGHGTFATSERILVFAGLMQTITGIVIYTGGCRERYVNGCLAHLISKLLRSVFPHLRANLVFFHDRGWDFLVLRTRYLRPLPWRLLRAGLGVEPFALPQLSLRGVC